MATLINVLCIMPPPMFAVVTFYLFQQCLKEKYCQCLFRMKFLRKQNETWQTWIHTYIIYETRSLGYSVALFVSEISPPKKSGHFCQLFPVMFERNLIHVEYNAFEMSESGKLKGCQMNGKLVKRKKVYMRLWMLTCTLKGCTLTSELFKFNSKRRCIKL